MSNQPTTIVAGETLYPIPATVPFDASPDAPNSAISKILTYTIDADNNTVPLKTLKITNNTDFTVFPMMRDGNEAAISAGGVGLYDPYDDIKTEYRGYIGYKAADGRYYFGLQKGQTITIKIPLVFWNGARMSIITNGQYLTPASGTPNPLNYNPSAKCVICAAELEDSSIKNGVVMWYRSNLIGPALDSPDQLIEWTVRDHNYLSSPAITKRTNGEISEREKVNLINYDASYVDNLYLPVAMAALDVPVPAPPYPPGKNPESYGWIGSVQNIEAIQSKIRDFTAGGKLLGNYFKGKGWPKYNIPQDSHGTIKIPAGQNIFAQSPLANARSSYDMSNNHFMLSSGGDSPIKFSIGAQGNTSTGNVISLSANSPDYIAFAKILAEGFLVVGYPPAGKTNPLQPGTKIKQVLHIGTGMSDPTTVEIDQPLIASQDGCTFDFFPPVKDYASEMLIKLWFSWAQLYLDATQKVGPLKTKGAVEINQATITFATPVEGLIEGMLVNGPGIYPPNTNNRKGGVVVLAISKDKKEVTLSQLSSENHPLSDGCEYSFQKPQPLPSTPDDLYTFDFSKDPKEPSRVPQEFAKKVYLVMASMAQIPHRSSTPYVLELMNNVVGGNMGFIFDNDAQRFSPDGLRISALIRDMIKSILRGVTDFTRFGELDGTTRVWYPDPNEQRGNIGFNAFNLDPFVWFIHVQLGFSGYGFSLDDDVADVGAGEATKLHLTIGGINGLIQANEWTIQAPYGPITAYGHWDPSAQGEYLNIADASNTTPIVITCKQHGLDNGDTVIIEEVQGNTAANNTFKVFEVTEDTFALENSQGNGDYIKGTGKWIRNRLPYIKVDPLSVFWKLKGDDPQAGFQGAPVAGPGIQKKGTIRVKKLGDSNQGLLILNDLLTNADGSPLAKGTYQWTFG